MIIKIPDNYTNVFKLKGENTDLIYEEARLSDMLSEEQDAAFETYFLVYEYWICEKLEKAFMEGAKSGIQAARQAAPDDNIITFRFKPD